MTRSLRTLAVPAVLAVGLALAGCAGQDAESAGTSAAGDDTKPVSSTSAESAIAAWFDAVAAKDEAAIRASMALEKSYYDAADRNFLEIDKELKALSSMTLAPELVSVGEVDNAGDPFPEVEVVATLGDHEYEKTFSVIETADGWKVANWSLVTEAWGNPANCGLGCELQDGTPVEIIGSVRVGDYEWSTTMWPGVYTLEAWEPGAEVGRTDQGDNGVTVITPLPDHAVTVAPRITNRVASFVR